MVSPSTHPFRSYQKSIRPIVYSGRKEQVMKTSAGRRIKVPKMEGATARWYAKLRSSDSQIEVYRRQAAQLTSGLPDGAEVLEVAPGPGYLTIEMARSAKLNVTGLDISRTFVQIAGENARRAGVSIDFRHGNAESMPFAAESFDLIVCQAAFKNFAQPVRALDEMCRVLRSGATAVIQDMSRDASGADIAREVASMRLSRVDAVMTRMTLATLRLRASSPARFESLAAESAFGTCTVRTEGITMEIRLTKP
jgi:ubiquinone/menaquinone biosynthesis C-methylase UbiE